MVDKKQTATSEPEIEKVLNGIRNFKESNDGIHGKGNVWDIMLKGARKVPFEKIEG